MSAQINFDTSMGEFVAKYPQTMDVFKKFELDYCCGGQKNIALAVEEKSIDWDEFKSALQKIINETSEEDYPKNWENESLINIVNYIEKKHHAFLWGKLASTEFLLNKLIDVHVKQHGDFLVHLKDMFMEFREKLEHHLRSEENTVFNYLKQLEATSIKGEKSAAEKNFTKELIKTLREDHQETGEMLSQIKSYTSSYKLPDYACASFLKLYSDLETMEDDLHIHINLENSILFPKIEKMLEQN